MILPVLLAMAASAPAATSAPAVAMAKANYRLCLGSKLSEIIAIQPVQPEMRDLLIDRAKRFCAAKRAEAAERIEAEVDDNGAVATVAEELASVETSVANAFLGFEKVETQEKKQAEIKR